MTTKLYEGTKRLHASRSAAATRAAKRSSSHMQFVPDAGAMNGTGGPLDRLICPVLNPASRAIAMISSVVILAPNHFANFDQAPRRLFFVG